MRLDKYLAERFGSRTRAARAIAEGRVTVNGRQAKASDEIGLADAVSVCEDGARGFVSEGGAKLQKALDDFGADVHGCTFADIGATVLDYFGICPEFDATTMLPEIQNPACGGEKER